MICRICQNNENNTSYTAKEMFFGLMDEFEYFRCSNCVNCLMMFEQESWRLNAEQNGDQACFYLKRK